MYRNEKLVGEAIRESGIDRSEIFVSESAAMVLCAFHPNLCLLDSLESSGGGCGVP